MKVRLDVVGVPVDNKNEFINELMAVVQKFEHDDITLKVTEVEGES